MEVENITGYGKGFVDSLTNPEFKVIGKVQIKMTAKVLWKELGLIRMTELFWKVYKEMKKMKHHNWSDIEKHGLPRRAIQVLLYPVLQMKVLSEMVGIERAQGIISNILDKTEEEFILKKSAFNSFGMPVKELKACNDSFINFKAFLKVAENTCEKEGLHKIEIERDTEDAFVFSMTYCAANEVAKECGNSAFCFPWCYLDEATFPYMGTQLGFKFEQPEKLSNGASICNFRFVRV